MSRQDEAYRIEKELAERLRRSDRSERQRVAAEVYEELYQRVHWHPDLSRTREERIGGVRAQTTAYSEWVARSERVLEVGAGSCDAIRELARANPSAFFAAVDITAAPLRSSGQPLPDNVRFIQAGAMGIPFENASFDFAYCSQVLEHFHPDDVPDHVAEVARVLRPGGWFGLDTPNRVTGPHDISRGYTREPTGLHLKEWTYEELADLLMAHGFDRVVARLLPGRIVRWLGLKPPGPMVRAKSKAHLERLVAFLPAVGLRSLAGRALAVDGIYVYARKGTH